MRWRRTEARLTIVAADEQAEDEPERDRRRSAWRDDDAGSRQASCGLAAPPGRATSGAAAAGARSVRRGSAA